MSHRENCMCDKCWEREGQQIKAVRQERELTNTNRYMRKELLKKLLELLNEYEENTGEYVGLEISFLEKEMGAKHSTYQIIGDILPINDQAKKEYWK